MYLSEDKGTQCVRGDSVGGIFILGAIKTALVSVFKNID